MAGCIPCFIIPILLFIFHRFIQPILLRYWNPWEKKDEKQIEEKLEQMLCKDGTCFKNKSGNEESATVEDTKIKTS